MGTQRSTLGRYRKRIFRFSIVATACGLIFGLIELYASSSWTKPKIEFSADDREQVRLVTLDSSINAAGEIQSADNTVVECEIERMYVYAAGRAMLSGASTRILKLIPDGTAVKKGDVICQLDSSSYEEAVRLQKINLEQARAMQRYTEMDLEVSRIALEEYRLGAAKQRVQSLKQQIALARSDSMRSTGRLDWSRKMYGKGYLSRSAMRAEEMAMMRADILMSRSQIALDTFEKYTHPRTEHSFRSRLLSQNWVLTYYKKNVESQQRQLEKYQTQVANCTVRAPHDGIVIYANEDDGDTRIEEGAEVRYKQDLCYLPNLKEMQVLAKVNESVVDKVRPGMKAKVHVQSLSGTEVEGVVEKIAQFPIPPNSWRSSVEVKNYFCVVKILNPGKDVRPGLTAELEVVTDEEHEILAVSPEAIHLEDDRSFCYVIRDDGAVEKREVRTAEGDAGHVAITAGLEEGESVVRIPQKVLDAAAPIEHVVMLDTPASFERELAELFAFSSPESAELSNPAKSDEAVQATNLTFTERNGATSEGY